MDFIILIAIILILLIGILIGVSYLIFKFIKWKKYYRAYRLIALIPILAVGYLIFDAFYPSEEFYEEDFTEVTGLTLPDSREFIYKSATFPDHFGDYTSVSIIKLNKEFYDSLSESLSKKGFKEVTGLTIINKSILKNYNEGYVKKTYNTVLTGKEYTVNFLSDNYTIIIERASW